VVKKDRVAHNLPMKQSATPTLKNVLSRLASNIKMHRNKLALTQEDMMDFGFNYRFFQKLESGTYCPSLRTLHRVASALKVDIKDLFS